MEHWRALEIEQERVANLIGMLPEDVGTAADIGARDGFVSVRLADRGIAVTALDLELPVVADPRITCVQGDATALQFDDNQFDLVVCTEVLEHIPSALLGRACGELARTARRYLLIGVPYKQDLRLCRSTCAGCGESNPPWGHVNSFDDRRLDALFPRYRRAKQTYIGTTRESTNALSMRLMDAARNPYGTYVQDEPCLHCGAAMRAPDGRTLAGRCLAKAAVLVDRLQSPFVAARPKWIHVLFEKR